MNEQESETHKADAKHEGENPDQGKLVQQVNAPPSAQSTTAPKADTESKHGPSIWSEILKTTLGCLRHYRDTPVEKSKRAEIAMVVLTLGIAVAAFWSACIFQGQLTDARKATEDNERRWKAQQRPWIGLSGGVEFSKLPVFQVFAATAHKQTAIDIPIVLKVKNFGVSPAFKTASEVQVGLRDNTLVLSQTQMTAACSLADGNSQGEGTASFGNSTVFPTGEITSSFETVTGQPIELAKIRRVWIAGCIAYQGETSDIIHHTKFWIMSYMIPENATPKIIKKNAMMTEFALPISGWQLVKTEAD